MMNDRDASPDPVGEPAAYQQFLLDLLGDDDPSSAQESTAAKLKDLAKEAGTHLYQQPRPGEWSVGQVIAHLADAEIATSGRYRWILAHNEPPLVGYDQDLWVEQLHDEEDSVEDLIELFEALRRANVALWRRSGPEQRARFGIHSERGPESYDLCFRMSPATIACISDRSAELSRWSAVSEALRARTTFLVRTDSNPTNHKALWRV